MDSIDQFRAVRDSAVLDTLRSTRTLVELERRDWLVFRQVASLVAGLHIEDVAVAEPELYGHWLDAQVRWRDLGLGHMTLARVEAEMAERGIVR